MKSSFRRDRSVEDRGTALTGLPVAGSIPALANTFAPTTHGATASTGLVGTVAGRLARWAVRPFLSPRNRRGLRLHRWLAINGSVSRI